MEKVRILNVSIDNLSKAELLEQLDSGVVFTPNVDHLVKLQNDKEFYEAYSCADFVVCDSKVMFYISRLLRSPIKEKVSGSDFFPAFYEYHRYNENIKIFLLGAREGVAKRAQERINKKVGRRIVVGAHSPSFGFENNEKECQEIIDLVQQSGATVLAIGVGAPKQEKFIYHYKDKFTNIKIFLAIGATIDFEAANVARAPKWLSEAGLEWLFRLLSEPRRLWKRYLLNDPFFFWLVLLQRCNRYVAPFGSSHSGCYEKAGCESSIET